MKNIVLLLVLLFLLRKILFGKIFIEIDLFFVCLSSRSISQMLNQTASRQEFIGRWVFLGTDGWGKKGYPVENFGRAAINAITIAPKSYPVTRK